MEKIMFDRLEKEFNSMVENKARINEYGYIEAVIESCRELDIEPELAAKYLSQPIKEKIRTEGEEINLLPRSPKLW
jgi:hypothetical protein